MKKMLSSFVCILLILGLTIPAFATGLTVPFTVDSLEEVGGTLTVDKHAMLDSGSITSEMYNALLEGNVIYSWYKNGMLTQEGTGVDANSYKVPPSDQGSTIYVQVSFYEDSSFQESKKCGEAVSKEVTVKVKNEPSQTTPATDPTTTQQTKPESTRSEPSETTPAETQPQTQISTIPKEDAFPWWGYGVIILGGMAAGIGIAFILIKQKKKS